MDLESLALLAEFAEFEDLKEFASASTPEPDEDDAFRFWVDLGGEA